MTTTISLSEETWKMLNRLKEAGDTFDDVIRRALKEKENKTKCKQT